METIQNYVDGFNFDGENYCCLHCKERFVDGVIVMVGGEMCDARRAARLHVDAEHGSPFEALLGFDKRQSGLSDAQRDFLRWYYSGCGDAEIAAATGTSQSAVRFQRFTFREKAKQARVILALERLLEQRPPRDEVEVTVHQTATQIDERYMTDSAEERKIIATYFTDTEPPSLSHLPPREKKKIVVLRHIAARFQRGKRYSEKEVNAELKAMYHDFATLRRYLIEYGFMQRTTDCTEYWLK